MIIKGKIRLNISGGCGESGRTQFVGSLEKSRGQFKQGVGCLCKRKRKHKLITEQKNTKLDGWADKPLHGQYSSRTDEKGMSY